MIAEAGRGAWMQTFTGRAFYPLTARPEDIDHNDIAHALSLQCRYNGHTTRFYSVAEHCVLMSETFEDRELALWALLHDAAEAYLGDMVRPLKLTPQMAPFRDFDDRLTATIAQRFGLWDGCALPPLLPAEVKDADNRILLDERAALLCVSPIPWHQDTSGTQPLGVDVRGWSPVEAEFRYHTRLDELLEVRA